MTLKYNGAHIYFESKGKGDALVLLHGFTESSAIWHAFTENLSKKFRVITIDLPGHGESENIGSVHPMEVMADLVKAVMDEITIEQAVLVGHSMGGYVALAFAKKYPGHTKGLGLFHSSSLADNEEARENREKAIEVIKNDHKDFLFKFIPDLFAPENRSRFKADIEQLVETAKSMSPRALIAAMEGMKIRSSTLDVLINATFPVMFIAGQKDTRVPFENIWVQMALTEVAYSLILKNVGHMAYLEARDKTLGFVRSFVAACYGEG